MSSCSSPETQQAAEHPRRWTNPYRLLLPLYDGRILRFDDWGRDRAAVGALLGNGQEVFCEIGSGSGNHLLGLAEQKPEALLFGFEVRYKRAVRTMQKAEVRGLQNIYVLRTKGETIAELFPPASVNGLFIHFPDPWDRKKWRKHQLLNEAMLNRANTVLTTSGFISIKTDHREYFEHFLALAKAHGCFDCSECSTDLYASEFLAKNIASEFENLFRSKEISINYAKLVRCAK